MVESRIRSLLPALVFGFFGAVASAVACFLAYSVVMQAQTWRYHAVAGEILTSRLVPERPGEMEDAFHLDLTYGYTVDGRAYFGSAVQFGGSGIYRLDGRRLYHREQGDRIVRRFPVGAETPVYYDPGNPAVAVLHRGPTFDTYAALLILPSLSLIVCAGVGFGFRPIFEQMPRINVLEAVYSAITGPVQRRMERREDALYGGCLPTSDDDRHARVTAEFAPSFYSAYILLWALSLFLFLATVPLLLLFVDADGPISLRVLGAAVLLAYGVPAGCYFPRLLAYLAGFRDIVVDRTSSSVWIPSPRWWFGGRRIRSSGVRTVQFHSFRGWPLPGQTASKYYCALLTFEDDFGVEHDCRIGAFDQDKRPARKLVQWIRENVLGT